MEFDPKRFLFMSVGFLDYLRERFDELSDEFIERGRQKGEDLQEFVDDIVENIPFLRPKQEYDAPDGAPESEKPGLLNFLGDLDIGSAVRDLLAMVGIAREDDAGNGSYHCEAETGSAGQDT